LRLQTRRRLDQLVIQDLRVLSKILANLEMNRQEPYPIYRRMPGSTKLGAMTLPRMITNLLDVSRLEKIAVLDKEPFDFQNAYGN
jgi:hypothetical protein